MQSKDKKILSTAIISLFIISMLSIFATVPLAFASPATLTLSPTSGPSGTIVTITGSGFTPYTYYRVYFDTNGNSAWNYGEPYKSVYVGSAGTFTTTLTIPSVPYGTYYIRADVYPYTAPAIASAQFIVYTIWDKLLDIKKEILAIEDKLDEGGSFYKFVNDWFETTLSAITNATKAILTAISDLKTQLEDKLDYIIAKLIAKPDFKGTFSGSYTEDSAFNPPNNTIAVNAVSGSGSGTINTTGVYFTFEGYLVSDWGHYSALNKGALVTGRFNITIINGDQIHIKIEGIQREVWNEGYTGINHLTGTYTIITGTGEYKGATGSGTIVADINTSDKTFSGSFDGIIKY